ncbi:two-component regulator propeller domain-containing protein [Reichenbachiella sp.]|uniref:two-component regulator propeller domain-containing protein n=5 Tax=Reichenbachiella sp. TaxID=2184521 RepID=UPI0032999C38
MIKFYPFILILFGSLCSCEPEKIRRSEDRDEDWNNTVILRKKLNFGKPKIAAVNDDSLIVNLAKGRTIKVNASEPKRNLLSKVKAGKPKLTIKDSAVITEIRPGIGAILHPVKKEIPSTGYLIQSDDTVFAPQINVAFWPVPTPAQSMRFRDAALHDIQFLDVGQGLPSSYVDAIYEDAKGNMWFGTYGGGVTRYNGNTFTTFTVDEGLPNNIIVTILKDREGNLWFGTDGSGISRYDGNTFTNYSIEQGFAGIYLETITEDQDGDIWFGTNGGGLSRFSKRGTKEFFTNYTTKNGLSDNSVWASLMDVSGNLWFGTRNGLCKFDGKSFKNFYVADGLPDNNIRSLFQDSDGNLWIGSEGGVSIYDGNSFITYSKDEGLFNNRIWHINQDANGDIWLGTDGGGVCKMNFSHGQDLEEVYFTFYTEKEGLSYDFIRSMYADKRGNMWFGIDGGGVTKFKTNSFTSFTEDKHLSGNSVWSIFEDKKGNLWFGSDVWGIYKYADGYFTVYMDDEDLLEYSVMDMLEDRNGNMWFATYGGGVLKYDGHSFTSFDTPEGFPHRDIYSMIEDRAGNLWFGTQGGGLVKYDGKFFTTYSQKDGLANDHIWTITEASNGDLWIGTFGGGVSKFDGKSFFTYTKDEGILNNSVNSIFEDHELNIWLGTDEGLNKLVMSENDSSLDEKLYSFTAADGLTNSITLSLIQDNNANLWVGTEGGITRLAQTDRPGEENQQQAYKFNTFVQQDGLKGLDVVINSVCLDSYNRMWWGTGKGLAMLDIDNIQPNTKAPKLQLDGVSIGQEFVDFRRLSNGSIQTSLAHAKGLLQSIESIVPFQNYPYLLALPHYLDHVSFSFSAIDWLAPHKVKYKYKLEGLDKDWSILNENISAEYRNLGYGTYTFKVKAIGSAGIWSETITYPLTIIRPWWHSWWARGLYLIVGILGILSFDRWRTMRILRKQKELQVNIEERNRALEIMVEERTAEIKRQQQMTEEANMALEQKVKERTKELLEKNKKLSDYAFVNAHNLRVPVANIKGIIQLFELVQSQEEKMELIELLKGQSNSLDDVLYEIKDMLEEDNYLQND